jgi:hypothetical protein
MCGASARYGRAFYTPGNGYTVFVSVSCLLLFFHSLIITLKVIQSAIQFRRLELAVLGVGIYAAGGPSDLWHTLRT